MNAPASEASTPDLIERYCRYEEDRQPPAWYTDPQSLDAWRAGYSKSMLAPLLAGVPGSTWLTIGDGYFGADANFLITHGVEATASAISGTVLRDAHHRGWIRDWSVQDAQALDYPDDSFDFVLCMEALQHCADPQAGIREAMRVARRGVLILNCIRREDRVLDRSREFLRRRVMGRNNEGPERYQPTGGPLNRLHAEGVAELAREAGMRLAATRRFNMLPLGRFWDRRAAWRSPAWLLMRSGFALSDLASQCNLMTPSFCWFAILPPSAGSDTLGALTAGGFALRTGR